MRDVLEGLSATGVSREAIERFLRAEPVPGHGTVLDLVAAEMANQLLGALGQTAKQDGAEVRRLRERGIWRRYDERPSE
jgi:hypothetical protein